MDQGYLCRVNIAARDLSQTLQDNRNGKLGVLHSAKPLNTDELDLDDQVAAPSRQLHTDGFIDDPAITHKERYRLAKILGCGGEVEHQPQLSRIYLCGKVKTERPIVQRLSSKFKEPGLCSRGNAIFGFVQILFGQADTLQQGRRVNIVIAKRGNRPSRGESGRRRQRAGCPVVGHLHAPFAKRDLV